MKKIILIIFLNTYIFACGGCIDASSAKAGAKTINKAYDKDDNLLAKTIQKHIKMINEAMIYEIKNNQNTNIIKKLEIDTLYDLHKFTFLLGK